MVQTAASLQQPGIAILDRDGVYGSVRQHLAAKKLGIRAHIGAEITCTDGARYPLLSESRKGYQNLCRLITRLKMRAAKGEGAATPEEIAEFSEGLVCLAGGECGPALDKAFLIFGDRTYAELQRHYRREQEVRNQSTVELARRLGIPLLASNGASYAHPAQRQIVDIFTCIREKTTIAEAGKLLQINSARHLKTAAAMTHLFADLPEAIASTAELHSRLNFTLEDLGYEFPPYPPPSGETMASFLRKRVDEGARLHYRPYTDKARKQIEYELDMICRLKLEGYFLIVWDIVQFCRANDILAQGRGSAANSAVCYCLGITAVDLIGMELLFERFLSEERGEWPDIDIDLPSGPWLIRKQDGGSAGPLRSGKVSTWEGGLRVPAIWWAPGKIPAGRVCDEILATLDILPTFATIAGISPPRDRVIDGVDITAVLHGRKGAQTSRQAFFYYLWTHLQAVRSGKWKLHLPRTARPPWLGKLVQVPHIHEQDVIEIPEPMLFDLEADIGETTDIATKHPDVMRQLLSLAERAREDIGDHDRTGRAMRFFDVIPSAAAGG